MKLGISEILSLASSQKIKAEKIRILRENDSIQLRFLLQCAFSNAITWTLPEGAPPYKPSPELDSQGMFYQEARRLYLFIEGDGIQKAPEGLTEKRKEYLFVQLLETLDSNDAATLIAIKDRNMSDKYPGITEKLIKEALPGTL